MGLNKFFYSIRVMCLQGAHYIRDLRATNSYFIDKKERKKPQ